MAEMRRRQVRVEDSGSESEEEEQNDLRWLDDKVAGPISKRHALCLAFLALVAVFLALLYAIRHIHNHNTAANAAHRNHNHWVHPTKKWWHFGGY